MFLLKPGLVSETKIPKTPTSLEVALERQRGCGLHLSMGWGAVLKPSIGKKQEHGIVGSSRPAFNLAVFLLRNIKIWKINDGPAGFRISVTLNASFRWVSAAQAHGEAFWRPFTARVEVWSVASQLSVVWCKNYGTFLILFKIVRDYWLLEHATITSTYLQIIHISKAWLSLTLSWIYIYICIISISISIYIYSFIHLHALREGGTTCWTQIFKDQDLWGAQRDACYACHA